MTARRPSGTAVLAAAVALTVVAGLGAGGWIAATDDDPPRRTTSVATTPDSTGPETEPAPGAAPETTPPADTTEGGGTERQPTPEPSGTTSEDTRKTSFPRDRRERRARHIPKRFAIPPAREFSGRGNASLGTVEIRSPAVVKWSSKGSLTIQFGPEEFPIVAPSASGQLIVPPYSFTKVRVIAKGRWTISIKPQR
jgi:hypothetical protein